MTLSQEAHMGGSNPTIQTHVLGSLVQAVRGAGRVKVFDPIGPNRRILLPEANDEQLGGPVFYFINISTVHTLKVIT